MDITLRVLCEGQTEQHFVNQVLGPHLEFFSVFAKPILLRGREGGILPWKLLRRSIKNEVGRSRGHEYATTMLDLYGLGKYPGTKKVEGESVADRVQRIENEMSKSLPSKQFIPYIQVHEFEALVLVDVDKLPPLFPDGEADKAPEVLRKSLDGIPPEEINDGESTAPSKRLIQAVPAYKFTKSRVGPLVTKRIGLPRLREACSHFNAWVTRLETLGE